MVAPQWRLQFGFHIFPKNNKDLIELNPYEPVSGRIIGLRIRLASKKSHILLNLSVIISGRSTEDTIPNMESETTQCA